MMLLFRCDIEALDFIPSPTMFVGHFGDNHPIKAYSRVSIPHLASGDESTFHNHCSYLILWVDEIVAALSCHEQSLRGWT